MWLGAALGGCLIGSAGPAAAQAIPFGGRTAAMGGTGIARGDDSAMPVLNPSGLALVSSSTLSLSASLYAFHHVSIPHFNADTDTLDDGFRTIEVSRQGIESNTVETLPSSLAYIYHVGGEHHQVLAASVTIPRSTSRRFVQNLDLAAQDPSGGTGQVIRDQLTFVENFGQYVLGFSYARTLSEKLRVGGTLGVVYTSSLITQQSTRLSVPATATQFNFINDSLTRESSSLDLDGIFGAQLDLSDSLSVGAVFHTPALHVHGNWDFSQDENRSDPSGTSTLRKVRESGDSIDAPPMKIGVGAGYRKSDCWSIAVDVTGSVAIKNDRRIKADHTESSVTSGKSPTVTSSVLDAERKREHRVNGSVGGEIRVGDETWIRMGAFTDLSLDPAVGQNKNLGNQLNRSEVLSFPFHRFGGTFGLGTITGPVDSTIGIAASYAQGDTVRLDPIRSATPMGFGTALEKTPARVFDFMFFVTGTVDLKKAASGMGGKLGGGS